MKAYSDPNRWRANNFSLKKGLGNYIKATFDVFQFQFLNIFLVFCCFFSVLFNIHFFLHFFPFPSVNLILLVFYLMKLMQQCWWSISRKSRPILFSGLTWDKIVIRPGVYIDIRSVLFLFFRIFFLLLRAFFLFLEYRSFFSKWRVVNFF